MIHRLIPIIIILTPMLLFAIGPDNFEEVGYWPIAAAVDIELDAQQLYLLLGDAVSVVERAKGGLELEPGVPVALQRRYDRADLAGNWLYLSDSLGYLAICRTFEKTVQVVSETRVSDSIFALASGGRYLYLATGISGIRVVDAGQRDKPEVVNKVQFGVRYTHLLHEDSLLFAVDELNGVEILRCRDEQLSLLSTIFTDAPVIGLTYLEPALYLSAGNNLIEKYELSPQAEVIAVDSFSYPAQVEQVLVLNDQLLLALQGGKLALADPLTGEISDTLQLPFPVLHIGTNFESGSGSVAVTDARGLAREIRLTGDSFGTVRQVSLSGRLEDMEPLADRLFVADAGGGISQINISFSGINQRRRLASGSVYAALAVTDKYLLAAENGIPTLNLFAIESGVLSLQDRLDWEFPTADLFVRQAGADDDLSVVALSENGAQGAIVTDSRLQTTWTLPATERIVAGFWNGETLGMLTADWRLQSFATGSPTGEPTYLAEFNLPESTRTLLSLPSEHLVTAGSFGVSVYRFSSAGTELSWVRDLTNIADVYDLAYEPGSQLLIGARGNEGVFYLDFSDPEVGATAYPVRGLSGVGRVAASGDHLYAVADDGLHAFLATSAFSPSPPSLPQDFQISDSYPNPFNAGTRIAISSPPGKLLVGEIDFKVYNILGQRVWEHVVTLSGSRTEVSWEGRDQTGQRVASGLYLMVVEIDDFSVVRKAMLLK